MTDENETPNYRGQVHCSDCDKAIDISEAFQPEGEEYTLYFCGLECYAHWRKQHAPENPLPGRK